MIQKQVAIPEAEKTVMNSNVVKRQGYAYHLVNIECMPESDQFNVIMELYESVGPILPYLAASLPACTYAHGTGVINLMDAGHIVAVYPRRITITAVNGSEEAEELCEAYFHKISRVKAEQDRITPVYERRCALTVLDIFRALPGTNCGLCGSPTCMAFAAEVYRREGVIASCPPARLEKKKFDSLLLQLQTNGYETP